MTDQVMEQLFGSPTPQQAVNQMRTYARQSRARYNQFHLEAFGERPLWKRVLWAEEPYTARTGLWVLVDNNMRDVQAVMPAPASRGSSLAGSTAQQDMAAMLKERELKNGATKPLARSILTRAQLLPFYMEACRAINWVDNEDAQRLLFHVIQRPGAEDITISSLLAGLLLAETVDDFYTFVGLPEDLVEGIILNQVETI